MPPPAAAALAYVAVTALVFRRLLPDLTTHLYSDLGDPLLNAAILGWNAAQIPLTEAWWNFPSFAPLSGVTVFTEHLLLTYPVATPVVLATGNPVLAYNVVFLLAPLLNGLAAYALARELTGSSRAAFIGGLAFAFAPYQSVHFSHLQTMWAFGLPIALLGLHRSVAGAAFNRPGALALLAFGWLTTTFANAYVLAFFPLLVALWCAWFVRPREWRRLVAPAVTMAVATLPVLPLLWGYRVRQLAYGLARRYDETQTFAADFVGLASVYYRAVPWPGFLPRTLEEGALFPGFAILALAVLALRSTPTAQLRNSQVGSWRFGSWALTARRLLLASGVLTAIVLARVWTGPWGWHIGPVPLPPFYPYRLFTLAALLCVAGVLMTSAFRGAWARRDAVIFWAVATVVLWLFALGPEPEWSTPFRALAYGPYRALMALPGFQTIRVPARMALCASLCLAMLAAYGTAALGRRYPRRARLLVALAAGLIVYEGWSADRTMRVPPPMRAGIVPRGALVLDLPIDQGFWNAVPQYRAVVGRYRTINGYSGYEPPFFLPFRQAIRDMNPHTFEKYRSLGDLYIILRPGETPAVAEWIKALPGVAHLYDVGDAAIYRLPGTTALSAHAVPLPLPKPGDPPFRVP